MKWFLALSLVLIAAQPPRDEIAAELRGIRAELRKLNAKESGHSRVYLNQVVEAHKRILDRLRASQEAGDVPPASVDRAEIEWLRARAELEKASQ